MFQQSVCTCLVRSEGVGEELDPHVAPQRGGVTDAHAQPVIGQRRLEVRLARHLVARHSLQLSILVGYNNVVEAVHLDVLRLTTSGEAQYTCEQSNKVATIATPSTQQQ